MEIILPLFRRHVAPPLDDDDFEILDETEDPVAAAYADAIGPVVEEMLEFASHQDVDMLAGSLRLGLDQETGKILLFQLGLERFIENQPSEHHILKFGIASTQMDRFYAALLKRAGTAIMGLTRKPFNLDVYRVQMNRQRALAVSWNLEHSPDVTLRFPFQFPFDYGDYQPCELVLKYHDFVDTMEILMRQRNRLMRNGHL